MDKSDWLWLIVTLGATVGLIILAQRTGTTNDIISFVRARF